MSRPLRLTPWLLVVLLCPAAFAADLAPGDVIFAVPAEQYGLASGTTPTVADGAHGGTALQMTDMSALAGAVDLQPGDYTLLVRVFAPAGDADGFFVEIGKERIRRTAPIGRWGVLAYPVTVKQPQQLGLSVIGQEPGMLVDDVVLVRGSFKDDAVDTGPLLPAAGTARVGASGLTRLMSGCRLAERVPLLRPKSIIAERFETVPAGVTGEHHTGPGHAGQAVFLDLPDGRFDMSAAALGPMPCGTIEWWVKPRPAAQVWLDQGWHYFLHAAASRRDAGTRFDLSRLPTTQLQLAVTQGDRRETIQLSTTAADLQQWHHLLVSWDFTEQRQTLWLMLDGVGQQLFFPKTFDTPTFSSLQFGNRPADGDMPYLPMDGGLDQIAVSRVPVTPRLAR
jgi:hypothetical protein